MQIDRIKLSGWCQHLEREIALTAGVNGILGPNGIGKSNILRAAFTAFTGKVLDSSIEENINWQRDGAVIDVDFSIDGEQGNITRKFSAPWVSAETTEGGRTRVRSPLKHSATLTFAGEKVTGATKTTDRLMELTGLTPKIIETHVFIAQDELFSLLFQERAERLRAFMQLHPDLEKVQGLCKDLAKELALYPQIVVTGEHADLLNRRDAARARLAEAEKELGAIEAAVVAGGPAYTAALDELAAGNKAADAERTLAIRKKSRETLREDISLSAQKAEALRHKVDALAGEVKQLREDAAIARAQLANLQNTEKMYALKQRYTSELESVAARLAGLKEPAVELLPAETEKELRENLQALLAEKATLDKLVGLLERGTAPVQCPTCGSTFQDPAETLRKSRERVAELSGPVGELSRILADNDTKRRTHEMAKRAYVQDKVQLEASLSGLRTQFEHVKDAVPVDPDAIAQVKAAVDMAARLETDLDGAQRELGVENARLAGLKGHESALEAEIADLAAAAVGVLSPARAAELDRIRKEYSDLSTRMTSRTGQLHEIRKTAEEIENGLLAYEKQVADAAARDKYRGLLEFAKSALRQDSLPTLVLSSMNRHLVGLCNHIMGSFGNPFSVDIDEEMDFSFSFPSGYVTSNPKRLSGGERCVLSVAMRFAINQLFARQVGILILDEPTEYMDKTNRKMMGELLQGAAAASRNAGLQTIIVTHADEINSFDNVVRIQ